MSSVPPSLAASSRFLSLDVLRGATVAFMILVNNPGSWSALYPPLAHAPWHGCTPTDLVFPFFLFAVGNALAFVMPGLLFGSPAAFWRKVGKRVALIFLIGLFLNASPFVRWDAAGELVMRDWSQLRIMGVLQRIALAYGAAAVVVYLWGQRGALLAGLGLLVAYWLACLAFGAAADPYSLEGFFGTSVDRALLGAAHLYKGEGVPFDPEGLVSTLPAVSQVLFGFLAGDLVRRAASAARLDWETVGRLFLWAMAALSLAYIWALVMPINKKLWTSSYVMLTTGLALGTLATLIAVLELIKGSARSADASADGRSNVASWSWRAAWTGFFNAFGKNALFIFAFSGFLPRVLGLLRWPTGALNDKGLPIFHNPLSWLAQEVFVPMAADPRLGSFLFSVFMLAFYWAIAAWMDRRGWYVKV